MPLITAAQAKAYIPGISGTGLDTTLEALIEAADQALAAWCRFPLPSSGGERTLTSASYVLYLDGPGGQELWLPMAPVSAVASIYDDPDCAYGSTTLVDSGDYTLFADEGLVRLDYDAVHGTWSKTGRALKVSCTAGYSSTPDWVRHACAMLVAHWWRREIPEIGAKPDELANVSDRVRMMPLPPSVRSAIAPARRLHGIAA